MLRFHRGSSGLLSFGTLSTPGKEQAPAPIHPGEGVQSTSCHKSNGDLASSRASAGTWTAVAAKAKRASEARVTASYR
jgi:hypothetical protein